MKKLFYSLIIILNSLTFAVAQNEPKNGHTVDPTKKLEDVVYLKNGAIIRGIIIEQVPDKTLEIKSNDNNYLIFNYNEIQKITKENIITDPTDYKTKGFLDITELTYGFGINTINTYHGSVAIAGQYPIIGMRSINGYLFNEHVSCGLGVGFEAFLDGTNSGALIPLTIDGRYYFKKGKFSPLVNLNAGYSIGVQKSSGLAANPSVGFKYFLNKKLAFLFNVGYKVQQLTVKEPDQWGFLINRIENYQFLSLSAGITF